MTHRPVFRAALSVLLVATGFFLAAPPRERLRTVQFPAASCSLTADLLAPAGSDPRGFVVLLHGLAGTKKVMSYLAAGFADQGLLVITPDLPGHGRSPGPFTPARAEECSASLMNDLTRRGLIDPSRTVLAGHSMGGAIAVRVAAKVPVAGVVSISPAPMEPGGRISPEMLLYNHPVQLPSHSLVISGAWEPPSMRGSAEHTVAASNDGTSKYVVLPHATHVSLLFDPATLRSSQEWIAQTLRLDSAYVTRRPTVLIGFALGLAGLIFLSAPFLHETLGKGTVPQTRTQRISVANVLLFAAASAFLAMFVLRLGNPLRFAGVFQGDYVAAFLGIVGMLMLALFRRELSLQTFPRWTTLLLSAFASLVVFLLFTGWFDYAFSEAWLTVPRWLRFPVFLAALLPLHVGEELFLFSRRSHSIVRDLFLGLSLRAVLWGALIFGLFVLHHGQTLLLLLAFYFFVFFLLQRLATDLVRRHTGSPACSALFGAILFAGFCLAIFPVA